MLRTVATIAVAATMARSGAFIVATTALLLAGCGGGRSVAQYEAEQRAAVDKQDELELPFVRRSARLVGLRRLPDEHC